MFIYFNNNPTVRYKKNGTPCRWHKCDCSIRAICAATGKSWLEIFDLLTAVGRECFDPFGTPVVEKAMERIGFVRGKSVQPKRGEKRLTVNDFEKKFKKGTYVLFVANHMVCVKDGDHYDTWDCGSKCVYTYWKLPS